MILDTNAVSALADNSQSIASVAGDVDTLSIPVIVIGEFRYGVLGSRYKKRYRAWLSQLLSVSRLLVIDEGTADEYAKVRHELRRAGTPIPSNDAWIAALARQHRLPVLSHDGHFDLVRGVKRLAW